MSGKCVSLDTNILVYSVDLDAGEKHDKAIEKLGYSPRGLEQGLRDTLEAEGRLPAPT